MKEFLKTVQISYKISEKRIFSKSSEISILNNINLTVQKGDILGITGESGSGKTTLAKILTGILKPTEGEIFYNYTRMSPGRISPMQILFQNNGEIINPFRRGIDILTDIVSRRYNKRNDFEVESIAHSLGISQNILHRRGLELSGGEQQRIAIAAILAANPELLILDEPFSAQDPDSQLVLLNLLKKINTEFNITLICVSHSTRILRNLCNRMIVMYKGSIVEEGTPAQLFQSPAHPYTKYLFSAELYKLSPEELYKQDYFDQK